MHQGLLLPGVVAPRGPAMAGAQLGAQGKPWWTGEGHASLATHLAGSQ